MNKVTTQELKKLLQGDSIIIDNKGDFKLIEDDEFLYLDDISMEEFTLKNYKLSKRKIVFGANCQIDKLSIATTNLDLIIFESSKILAIEIYAMDHVAEIMLNDMILEKLFLVGQSRVEYFLVRNSKVAFFKINCSSAGIYDNCKKLRLADSEIDIFEIYGQSKINKLSVQRTSLINDLSIYGSSEISSISLINRSKIETLLLYEKAEIDNLLITQKTSLNELRLLGGVINNSLTFRNLTTDRIKITERGTVFFPKNDNKIVIENVSLEYLGFVNFHTSKTISLVNLKNLNKNAVLEFFYSSFNYIEFINSDLSRFKYIIFENSNLKNGFLANSLFPDRIVKNDSKDEILIEPIMESEYSDSLKQEQLFAEQIKTIYQKQGNKSESLNFQAKELNALYRNTNCSTSFSDCFSLFVNKYTNSFGTNWVKALNLFFLGSLLLFIIICGMLPKDYISKEIAGNMAIYNLSNYLKFAFPISLFTNKAGFLSDLDKTPGIEIVLSVSYLFLLLMYYQIIVAFRKFNRK